MNKLTRKIRDKGYALPEFLKIIGYSLRWYRTHEKEGAAKYEYLRGLIDDTTDLGEHKFANNNGENGGGLNIT